MINKIYLRHFKCHENLVLPLSKLTILTGFNSSGKSTVLQALCLLSQSLRKDPSSKKLLLNGDFVNLGCFSDVRNFSSRAHITIGIAIEKDFIKWHFQGDRRDQKIAITEVQTNDIYSETPTETPFQGFIPNHSGAHEVNKLSLKVSEIFKKLTYIGAERAAQQQTYRLIDEDELTMGSSGDEAFSILYHNDTLHVDESLRIENISPILRRQVEAWMREIFPKFSLDIQPIEGTSLLTVKMKTNDGDEFSLPQNVGFGLSQVLPIITAGLYAKAGDILLFDNPEAHLHPAGQSILIEFLARVASTGVQIILETHSDHIINGVRKAIKDSEVPISATDVGIHFFSSSDSGESQVNTIVANEQGDFDHWPKGFFDQYEKELSYLAGWDL